MAKWTEDITYKFVQELVKYECLLNCKDPNNKIKDVRDAAFLSISEAMNIPGFGGREVYTKMRNLKSTYSQEVKKVKQSIKSGAGTDEVYIPQIKWFKLFDDALKTINGECMDSQSYMLLVSQALDGEEPSTSQDNQSAEENNTDATREPKRNHDEDEQKKSPIPRKRIKRRPNRFVSQVKNVAATINTKQAPPTQTVTTETEFDIFGKSVAAQLKSMPLHQAIEGQMFIQNYLCQLRLRQMGHDTSNYEYSPPPNFMFTG